MKQNTIYFLLIILIVLLQIVANDMHEYKQEVEAILQAAFSNKIGYERLSYMCDEFGSRLSGSTNLAQASNWILQELKNDLFSNIAFQNVSVTHWERGNEYGNIIAPVNRALHLLALGGSIATPNSSPLTADVVVVKSFEELEEKCKQAQGKIVLFNKPWTGYGSTSTYRANGASRASKCGAVGSLTRSVTPLSLQSPHTGQMSYSSSYPKIPAFAVTVEDAELLQRMQDRGQKITITLYSEAKLLPPAPGANIIAELKGTTKANEIIVIGGHIDSWDVGQGAMDDGGACVAAWESMNILKQLIATNKIAAPARTIRLVLFTNEENGLAGATKYFDENLGDLNNTVFAMESDIGIFKPTGLGFTGTLAALRKMKDIAALLEPFLSINVHFGVSGADVGLLSAVGVPAAGLEVTGAVPDQYFWYHHSAADTIDKIAIEDFNECIGTFAAFSYVIASMPENLPRIFN